MGHPLGLSRWLWLLALLSSVLVARPTSGEDQGGRPRSDYVPMLGLHVLRHAAPAESRPLSLSGTSALRGTSAVQSLTDTPAHGWPSRGFDPANTGHTVALGPVGQAQAAWTFAPGASVFVWRPAVAPDGTIYVTTVSFTADGVDGRLYALNPDGSVKWQTELTTSTGLKVWASATPALDSGGNIYIAWAHDRNFQSLTAISLDRNGAVRWRFEPAVELEVASHQEPVLVDGALYAAVDTGFQFDDSSRRASIFALDPATGRLLWRWESPNLDSFLAGPAVGRDGHVYHASASNNLRAASGYLYRIRPNGVLDWSVDIGVGTKAPPALDAQNSVYLGDLAGLASKHSSAGVRLWGSNTMSGQIYASPMLRGDRVTVGGANTGLHVLDAATGEPAAVFAPGAFPMSQASDRAGNTFFYSFDPAGKLFAYGRGGRQWWTFDTGAGVTVSAVAIAADGKVLVSNTATLTAYVGPVPGDMNCDGVVNASDVDPFVVALADPGRYARRYPGCDRALADVNGDGSVNAFDIAAFLKLLR